jgi:hypothetical protein
LSTKNPTYIIVSKHGEKSNLLIEKTDVDGQEKRDGQGYVFLSYTPKWVLRYDKERNNKKSIFS